MPATSSSVGSGAAGAAIFADSDSRKYRYFEPKGKRATHYEDVTVDVQPDPERYLIQNWIISTPDGKGAYVKDATAAKSSNWHAFRAPDQEWERTHYQRQSKIETMVQSVISNARRSGVLKTFDKAWLTILQAHLGAWKHAEFGLGTSLMQAQRYGYTQMINNATLTNSSYKLRLAQDITLYLAEIGMDIPDWDDTLGKKPGLRTASGRARAKRSRPSWARATIWSSISRSTSFSSRWSANFSAPASSCRSPPPTTTSSHRR